MANSFVQVPPDSTGKSVDTWTTAVLGYHRQGIVIGDPSTDANVVPISSRLRLPVELEQQLDYDTGGGTINVSMVGIALPGSGAIVAGGTVTNPFTVNVGTSGLPSGGATAARQDTGNASLASIDGKITAVNTGAVVVASSALPSGAATEATLAAAAASLAILDDWDETDRAKVNLIVGQAGILGGTGVDAANVPRVSLVTNVALPAGNNNIGDVDVASSVLPTGASTLAEQQSQTTALQIMDDWDNAASDGASVSGDVAHDSADAGEPVKIGAKAVEFGTNPTAVAANDRTNSYATRSGIPFHLGGHPNILTLEHADTDGETNVAIITVSSGTRIVVTQIQVVTDEACTASVGFRVGFATATTPTTTGVVLTHPGLVPGSGISRGDGSGILGIGADDEDLRITSEVPTGGSLRVLVSYFTQAV